MSTATLTHRPARVVPDASPPGYAALPYWLIDATAARPRALTLYAVMKQASDRHTRQLWHSRARLARALGVRSVRTIDAALRELRDIGALTITRRITSAGDPTSSLYTVHDRPASPAAASAVEIVPAPEPPPGTTPASETPAPSSSTPPAAAATTPPGSADVVDLRDPGRGADDCTTPRANFCARSNYQFNPTPSVVEDVSPERARAVQTGPMDVLRGSPPWCRACADQHWPHQPHPSPVRALGGAARVRAALAAARRRTA